MNGSQNFGLQPGENVAAVTNSTSYNFCRHRNQNSLAPHAESGVMNMRRYYDNFLNAGGATNTTNFMTDPVFRYQGDWGNGRRRRPRQRHGQLSVGN